MHLKLTKICPPRHYRACVANTLLPRLLFVLWLVSCISCASNDFFLELHSLGSPSKPVSTHLSHLQLLYLITFFLVLHIFSYYPKLFLLLIYVLVSRLSIPIRGKLYEAALFFLFTVVLLYLDGDQAESRSPVNLEWLNGWMSENSVQRMKSWGHN